MSVQYDERQDRLSFRISNQDHQEFRLWLTRAMSLRLLPHLQAARIETCGGQNFEGRIALEAHGHGLVSLGSSSHRAATGARTNAPV